MIKNIGKLSDRAWNKLRSTLIGASELSIILGTNKYESAEELFERKINNIERPSTEAMETGLFLEKTIAQMFYRKTNIKLFKNKNSFIIDDTIIATPDYFTADNNVVEIKSMGDFAFSNTKFYKGVPLIYYPQIQAYLHITYNLYNKESGFFVILHGNKLEIIEVDYDQDYFEIVIEKAKTFVEMLKSGVYIPDKIIDKTEQNVSTDINDMDEIYNELLRINNLINELNERKNELFLKIKDFMSDKEVSKYARWIEQERFDSKLFRENHKELYEKYKVTTRILRINYGGSNENSKL